MKLLPIIVLGLCCNQSFLGQVSTSPKTTEIPKVAKEKTDFEKLMEEYLASEVARIEKQIENDKQFLKSAITTTKKDLEEKEKVRQRIKSDKERLAKIKSGKEKLTIPSLSLPVKIGDFGTVNVVNIFQITSKDSALCKMYESRERSHILLFKGWNFSDKVDGSGLTVNKVVKVTGTYSYTTAIGGSKTIFVVEEVKGQ